MGDLGCGSLKSAWLLVMGEVDPGLVGGMRVVFDREGRGV